MQKRNCCRSGTDWRKRRRGIGSRSAKRGRAGLFRRVQFWKRCCRRCGRWSRLRWKIICFGDWQTATKLRAEPVTKSRRAHLLTTCKTGGGMPAASCALRGGFRFLRKATDNATAPAGAAVIVCADGKFPAPSAVNQGVEILYPHCRLPAQTCHRQLCRR